jgi:hypothetical protein
MTRNFFMLHSVWKLPLNGLRYWCWGGHGLCLGAEKSLSQHPAVRPARAAVRSMALLGCGSLPSLGLNTSKHFREQEENEGTCCPPTEDANNDGLRRRDRKPDQSRET